MVFKNLPCCLVAGQLNASGQVSHELAAEQICEFIGSHIPSVKTKYGSINFDGQQLVNSTARN